MGRTRSKAALNLDFKIAKMLKLAEKLHVEFKLSLYIGINPERRTEDLTASQKAHPYY